MLPNELFRVGILQTQEKAESPMAMMNISSHGNTRPEALYSSFLD